MVSLFNLNLFTKVVLIMMNFTDSGNLLYQAAKISWDTLKVVRRMALGKSNFMMAQYILANLKMTNSMALESMRIQLLNSPDIGPMDK